MDRLSFIFMILASMLVIRPAFSYIEIADKDDAVATAGEQNTNLYQLNLQGTAAVKKLKKVDDIITRDEAAGKNLTFYDVNELLESDAVKQEKEDQKFLLKEVAKMISEPKKLNNVIDVSIYTQLKNLPADKRDSQIARQLMNSLKGRY